MTIEMVVLDREYLINKYGRAKLLELTEINLYNSRITKIDSNAFESVTKLEKLILNNNEITSIDGNCFSNLSNLKYIYLNDNKLKTIDANTFKGPVNLYWLTMSRNEIEEIDENAFESLSNLKYLNLDNNRLRRVGNGKCFEPLKSIEVILLYENKEMKSQSFVRPSHEIAYNFVKKYGYLTDWNMFLQQFCP